MLCEGRHIRIVGAGETLTIDNGLSGYKRNDIIAMHYERDSSDIETCTLVVIKGNQATDTQQDPPMPTSGKLLEGAASVYWPLYRIVIDGLTPQDPVFIAQRQALYTFGGGSKGQIPTGADLNDYKTPGVYKIMSSARADTLANTRGRWATEAGSTLIVEDNGGSIVQTWVNNSDGMAMHRRFVDNSWESWTGELSFTRFNASETRSGDNMLLASLTNTISDANKAQFVSEADASKIINLPTIYNDNGTAYTGTFIGFRTVDWLTENRVFVTLNELYPQQGRVWTNHYNATGWSGWRASGGIDSIVAEGETNGFK